ncbi:MAG: type VI secretion system contractile sheath large subunit [Bryobacteraceae bacterium]
MSERIPKVSVGIEVGESTQPIRSAPDSDTPFRILILGDFSGRGFRGERAPIAGRRPLAVDCDNLDAVLASLSPSVQLPQGTLRFRALDDFHPDHIYQSTALFQKLAGLRNQPAPAPVAPRENPQPAASAVLKSGRSLLENMMERADEEPASRVVEAPDAMAEFIKRAVEPHLAPRQDPRQQEWATRVDAAAGEQMRAILHHPHFQALEAAWRALAMLVDRLQPDADLKLYLFDATLEELMADARSLEQCLGGYSAPWALVGGNFVFGQTAEDAARLRWLGRLASSLRAPFLGEATPPSDPSPGPHWQELVRSQEAHWIGLALPRFLLRLPYGKATAPAEQFHFEEMPESVHADYLWGNPAFFCANVLGLAFRSDGWGMHPARHREIGNLPQHIYRADGESVAKPCAEVLLTDTDAEFILDHGFMPLASMKDRDSILLVRMQSIADPPAPLSGRWA